MLHQIVNTEVEKIFAAGMRIGIQWGLKFAGRKPSVISQNKAYKEFVPSRVKNWVEMNRIKPITVKSKIKDENGKITEGKTSTVYYDYQTLLLLDASDKAIICK